MPITYFGSRPILENTAEFGESARFCFAAICLEQGLSPMIWPRKPNLTPEYEREFNRVGVAEVRRRLTSNTGLLLYGTHGPQSSQAQAWLRWKDEYDAFWNAFWIKAGIGAAAIAAFVALLAWLFPLAPGK